MRPRPNGYKEPHEKDPDGLVEWCCDALSCLGGALAFYAVLHHIAPDVVPSAFEIYAMVMR